MVRGSGSPQSIYSSTWAMVIEYTFGIHESALLNPWMGGLRGQWCRVAPDFYVSKRDLIVG